MCPSVWWPSEVFWSPQPSVTSSNSHHILADLSSGSKIPSTYSLALTSLNVWFQRHLNHVSNLQEIPIHRSEMALSIKWSWTTSGLFHFLILFIPYSSIVYCTPLCHKHFYYFQVVSNGDSKNHSFQKIKFLSQMGLEATKSSFVSLPSPLTSHPDPTPSKGFLKWQASQVSLCSSPRGKHHVSPDQSQPLPHIAWF